MFSLQSQPVIIHLDPKPTENEVALHELTRVFVGALGVTGAFLLVGALIGLGIAGVLYWRRSRG
ncbi:MAG TPA: hypothetical protein VHZ73_12960 [Vicinamibacterales bacterium]|nr:hypothetical protein [Vicinamibacterales bacterium]